MVESGRGEVAASLLKCAGLGLSHVCVCVCVTMIMMMMVVAMLMMMMPEIMVGSCARGAFFSRVSRDGNLSGAARFCVLLFCRSCYVFLIEFYM